MKEKKNKRSTVRTMRAGYCCCKFPKPYYGVLSWDNVGRVAQSVQRLATGWTFRGSNPGGGEIFRTCPDRPWGPPSPLYNGYRVFPGVKSGRSVRLAPHPFLVPWSRKSRVIPLLSVWAIRPVQSLSACTRVHFTFTLVGTIQNVPSQWC